MALINVIKPLLSTALSSSAYRLTFVQHQKFWERQESNPGPQGAKQKYSCHAKIVRQDKTRGWNSPVVAFPLLSHLHWVRFLAFQKICFCWKFILSMLPRFIVNIAWLRKKWTVDNVDQRNLLQLGSTTKRHTCSVTISLDDIESFFPAYAHW